MRVPTKRCERPPRCCSCCSPPSTRRRAVVRRAEPLTIHAIAAATPIDVFLGPAVDQVPMRWRGIDFFTLPIYADLPQRRLEADSDGVVFEEA